MLNNDFIILRLKSRFLQWLFWTLIWVTLGILFAFVFQSFSASAPDIEVLFTSLPEPVLNSFNIDIGYLKNAESFLSGQFLTVYTLIGTIFAFFQGVSEIGGKIQDNTIVNYLTKKISRSNFYLWQTITNLYFIASSNFLVWLSIYINFRIFTTQQDISIIYFLWGFVSTSILFVSICNIGQLLGVLYAKNIAIFSGIGLLVFSWFLNSLSNIEGYPEWLKPWSVFYYLNVKKLRDDFNLDLARLFILIIVSIATYFVGVYIFRKKDIV